MATKKTSAPAPKKNALAKTDPNKGLSTAADNVKLDFDVAEHSEFDQKDLALPRIRLLQSGSPEVKKGDQQLEGAAEGDFLDSVAGTILASSEDGFVFVPVTHKRLNLEWIPEKQGGGLAAIHTTDEVLLKTTKDEKSGKLVLSNGHEISTTSEYIGLAIVNGEYDAPRLCAISLASTQLKKARGMNTALDMLLVDTPAGKKKPRIYYSAFDVTSVPESNSKGSWMGWRFANRRATQTLENGEAIYDTARNLWTAISAGKVKVAAPENEYQNNSDSGAPEDGATL